MSVFSNAYWPFLCLWRNAYKGILLFIFILLLLLLSLLLLSFINCLNNFESKPLPVKSSFYHYFNKECKNKNMQTYILIITYYNLISMPLTISQTKQESRLLYHCFSVAQSCPTFCDPMDCNTPGFPVLHNLLELVKIHLH